MKAFAPLQQYVQFQPNLWLVQTERVTLDMKHQGCSGCVVKSCCSWALAKEPYKAVCVRAHVKLKPSNVVTSTGGCAWTMLDDVGMATARLEGGVWRDSEDKT